MKEKMDFEDMINQKQAEIITELREENKLLHRRLQEEIRNNKDISEFWSDLKEQISKNSSVKSAWDDFLIVLKLGADEEYLKKHNQ